MFKIFDGCCGLTSITIGSGIKSIDYRAFASCRELADVYCYAEAIPSTDYTAFNYSYTEYPTLHVPASSVSAYKKKDPWKKFKEIVALTGNDPNPTGIKTTETSDKDNTIIYDLNGLRVEHPSKGIYIKNGKKYVSQRGHELRWGRSSE